MVKKKYIIILGAYSDLARDTLQNISNYNFILLGKNLSKLLKLKSKIKNAKVITLSIDVTDENLSENILKICKAKKIKINKTYSLDGWVDSLPFNKKNIFEIPSVLDSENYNNYNFTKNIIKFWKNKKFGKDMFGIVFNLIKISKKYKAKSQEFNNEVSDNIYEMF